MSLSIDFDSTTGFLPPGRISLRPAEAYDFLVTADRFARSTTRNELWGNFEEFLSRFVFLEEQHAGVLPGPLLDRVWLGGSFVSSKLNPRNMDVTLFLHGEVRQALRGRLGAGILAKSRSKWEKELNISPLIVDYHPAGKIFRLDELTEHQRHYFTSRGRWDDWWQRIRLEGYDAPSLETAAARRGYLEVRLDD